MAAVTFKNLTATIDSIIQESLSEPDSPIQLAFKHYARRLLGIMSVSAIEEEKTILWLQIIFLYQYRLDLFGMLFQVNGLLNKKVLTNAEQSYLDEERQQILKEMLRIGLDRARLEELLIRHIEGLHSLMSLSEQLSVVQQLMQQSQLNYAYNRAQASLAFHQQMASQMQAVAMQPGVPAGIKLQMLQLRQQALQKAVVLEKGIKAIASSASGGEALEAGFVSTLLETSKASDAALIAQVKGFIERKKIPRIAKAQDAMQEIITQHEGRVAKIDRYWGDLLNALDRQYEVLLNKINVESKQALKVLLNELSVLGSSIKAIDSAKIETLIQDATQKITVILDGISRAEDARVVETQLMSLKAEINQLLDKLEGAGCPEDLLSKARDQLSQLAVSPPLPVSAVASGDGRHQDISVIPLIPVDEIVPVEAVSEVNAVDAKEPDDSVAESGDFIVLDDEQADTLTTESKNLYVELENFKDEDDWPGDVQERIEILKSAFEDISENHAINLADLNSLYEPLNYLFTNYGGYENIQSIHSSIQSLDFMFDLKKITSLQHNNISP